MTAAVFLDFKGMTVEHVTKLRAEFRKAGVEYKVVKNTLVKHALKDAPYKTKLDDVARRDDGHRVELRRPQRRRQGREGVPKDPAGREAPDQGRAHRRLGPRRESRRGPARDDARQERAPRDAARDAPSAAPEFVALLAAPAQNFVYVLAAKEREGK